MEVDVLDYEIKIGFTKRDFNCFFERENGKYYRGFYLKTKDFYEIVFGEIKIREAQEINMESIFITAIESNEGLKLGGVIQFERWANGMILPYLMYESKYIKFCWRYNIRISLLSLSLEKTFPVKEIKNLYVKPIFVWNNLGQRPFVQIKTELKYQL